MITFESSGNLSKTEKFLMAMSKNNILASLDKYGREGVEALASATPSDSGVTATSWDYTVKSSRGSFTITWTNSHLVDGVPVVVMLQYGHGTGTGGYVQGRDFINPAMKPVFDRIANDVWREVVNA